MRTAGTIVAVILFGLALGNVSNAQESEDLSEYYGFGGIEILKLDWGVRNLQIADFNGDKRNDIAVINNKKARIEMLIQKKEPGPDEPEVAVDTDDIDVNTIVSDSRFKKQAVAVSENILSLVCGDLNSDGKKDLAFYGEPKGLYVILQKANDKKTAKSKTLSWRSRKKIKIDDGAKTSESLVCADLNNDGMDDLALAGRDGVYIILQEKDGSLAEPVKYPSTVRIRAVKVCDLNGDKINDLVLITNDAEKPIHVRFGLRKSKNRGPKHLTDKGQLGPQVRFFIERPFALELDNIDRKDGDELLSVDSQSKRLICYKLASEKDADADWPILFYPLESGEGRTDRDIVVADINGDKLDDVVISDPGAAELIFYKQTAGIGLAEPVRFPAFSDIDGLCAADIDGDGKTEIGVLSVKEKIAGISKFDKNRLTFPQPLDLIGEPLAMELADADNDKTTDCVYISRDVNDVLALRIIYSFASSISKDSKRAGQGEEAIPVLELKELLANPEGMKVIDVDQDGLKDVLIFVKYEFPLLVRQIQKGQFEVVDSPKAQSSLIKEASLRSTAVADVDNRDGQEMLLAQKNFARSLIFSEGKSWSIVDQYNAKNTENQISAVAAFEIEGKGPRNRPAILLLDGQKGQLQILKAGEDKTYRFEKELEVGRWNAAKHLKCLYAALTGNNAKSILLFDGEKFALITPPSHHYSGQKLEQQFSYETKIKDGRYGDLTCGDINSDGRSDIVMVEYNRNHIEILTLDFDGKAVPAMRFKLFEEKSYRGKKQKPSIQPQELKIADVTGDGKADLVTIIHDRIIIYPQD